MFDERPAMGGRGIGMSRLGETEPVHWIENGRHLVVFVDYAFACCSACRLSRQDSLPVVRALSSPPLTSPVSLPEHLL